MVVVIVFVVSVMVVSTFVSADFVSALPSVFVSILVSVAVDFRPIIVPVFFFFPPAPTSTVLVRLYATSAVAHAVVVVLVVVSDCVRARSCAHVFVPTSSSQTPPSSFSFRGSVDAGDELNRCSIDRDLDTFLPEAPPTGDGGGALSSLTSFEDLRRNSVLVAPLTNFPIAANASSAGSVPRSSSGSSRSSASGSCSQIGMGGEPSEG